jgi:hypothetical protein
MYRKCQEKNEGRVEKGSTIFEGGMADRCAHSNKVVRLEPCERRAGYEIGNRLRKYYAPRSASNMREQAELSTEYSDENRAARVFVRMGRANAEHGKRRAHGHSAMHSRNERALHGVAQRDLLSGGGDIAKQRTRA